MHEFWLGSFAFPADVHLPDIHSSMTKSRQQRDKKNEDKAKAKIEQQAQTQRDEIEQDVRAEYEKQREIDARRLGECFIDGHVTSLSNRR